MSDIRLGSFEVRERIASGGMGDVWRGVHVVQDVPVAIKVLRQSHARHEYLSTLFRREVRAVAQLDHPGIITLFDIGEVSETAARASGGALGTHSPYLVMEYLERGSLESLTYPLPWPAMLEILVAVLDGLAHAHARGITHRDLKPGNILMADVPAGPPIRLTDFGIAFMYSEAHASESEGTAVGTPVYMAPEQFTGEWRHFGPWTDLYGLGCVAYELTSGQLPFSYPDLSALRMAHISDQPPALSCPADYPDGFEQWVMRLLEKDPAHRYRCCADAAAALLSLPTPVPSGEAGDFVAATWAVPATGRVATNADWRAPPPPQRSFRLIGAGLRLFGLRTVPMVDRDAERDLLWTTFRRVAEHGTPALVALEGPAGVGKSRLAAWLCERTHELGLAEFVKAEHEGPRGKELALSHMLATAWSCQGASVTELQDRVSAVLSAAGEDSSTLHHAVAEFVAPSALGSDFSPGMFHAFPSRSARFHSLFEALGLAYGKSPLVMWLDDVHWSAEALHFVKYALTRARAESMRLMIVLTARDDLLVDARETSALLRELCHEEEAECVAVRALSAADSRRLTESLLHLEGDLAERLAARSGGNPLYATQVVGDWVNRGTLTAGERGFVLAGRDPPPMPSDVHALWTQRLERVLDERVVGAGRSRQPVAERMQAQVLLELAATLGGRVDLAEWLAVCALAGVPDPSPMLEPLLASRMAERGPDSWSFSHSMLRESIERIARERNRWPFHNRLCADMLERRRPTPHWGDSERIGRHRFEAHELDAALGPLLRGAKERMQLEEFSVALDLLGLLDRALDELGRPADDPVRLEGWLLQADINSTRRALDEAKQLADAVRERAQRPETRQYCGMALIVLARVHHYEGRVLSALDEYRDAERILRTTGPRDRLATCLSEHAHAMLEVDRLDPAWHAFHEAQEICEDLGQLVPWAENLLGLARVALRQGNTDYAMTLCRRVRGFGRREGLSRIEAAAWGVLAEVQVADRQLEDAERSLERSITLFDRLGLTRQSHYSRLLKISISLESGSRDSAAAEFAQLRMSPEVDLPQATRVLTACVGLAIAADGADDEFQSKLRQVRAVTPEIEVATSAMVRSLQLAISRARDAHFADRAQQVQEFVAGLTSKPGDDGRP